VQSTWRGSGWLIQKKRTGEARKGAGTAAQEEK
jgi:hypothetical protein